MSNKKYRSHSPELKIATVRRHLIDKIPVSNLCEEHHIRPSLFYKWQKELFEFALRASQLSSVPQEMVRDKTKIKRLEQKLAVKNEVLAELMQEYVALKKTVGEI
jgi:transposase-like protein